MQLAGDPNQLLVGTLKPGDRVDILGSFKVKNLDDTKEEIPVVKVVLRDILVLQSADGETAGSKLGANQGGNAIQLAVTDAQARKLYYTTQNGAWHLTLRPVVDPSDSGERLETMTNVICDGLPRAKYAACGGGGV
jgi:Flp pilus assembly protein CpaB